MQLLTVLDYMNAFIGSLIAILGITLVPEIRKNLRNLLLTITLGILSFILGICKIKSDNSKDLSNSQRIAHLDTTILSISKRDSILQDKVDSNNVFLRRLEKLGIRDSANKPYFFNKGITTFKSNSIRNATNVESHNQKGGQTARDIINNN